MAYTTAFKDTSSDTLRSVTDKWASTVTTVVDQLNTTPYWIAQSKEATANVWTFSTSEPTA